MFVLLRPWTEITFRINILGTYKKSFHRDTDGNSLERCRMSQCSSLCYKIIRGEEGRKTSDSKLKGTVRGRRAKQRKEWRVKKGK